MGMLAPISARISLAGWVAGAVWLGGCNAVLGIHQPPDTVIDNSPPLPNSAGFAGSSSRPTPDAGPGSAGSSSRPASDGGPSSAGNASAPSPELDAGMHQMRRANWPMPNPKTTGLGHSASYRVDDGLVVDDVTHLEWQRTVDAKMRTRDEAAEYCDGLSNGDRSFRLPSRIELLSLIDFTKSSPTIDSEAFPSTPEGRFWTDSSYIGDGAGGWLVNFARGVRFVSTSYLTDVYLVRCVAGPEPTGGRVAFDGQKVIDPTTQLEWQRESRPDTYTWSEAVEYCKTLDLAGTGWRVPTVKELQTLVDETQAVPAIDRQAFPDTQRAPHWTSSLLADSDQKAWSVNFDFGFDSTTDVTTPLIVRCVR